jgi:hypothetical protein
VVKAKDAISNMTETSYLETVQEFRQECLGAAPPGTAAFHAQLYPRTYPGDQKRRDKLQADGLPLTKMIGQEYRDWVRWCNAHGIQIARLVLLHDANDPDVLKETRDIFGPVQALREKVRVASYGRQVIALAQACGESPIVRAYKAGVAESVPTNSFWSVHYPSQSKMPARLWLMSYDTSGQFEGGPLYTAPFSTDVQRYDAFWRGVFDDPVESRAL